MIPMTMAAASKLCWAALSLSGCCNQYPLGKPEEGATFIDTGNKLAQTVSIDIHFQALAVARPDQHLGPPYLLGTDYENIVEIRDQLPMPCIIEPLRTGCPFCCTALQAIF